MKKKIRDLAEEEIRKICVNATLSTGCESCPLHLLQNYSVICIKDFENNKDLLSDKVLDKEVEI